MPLVIFVDDSETALASTRMVTNGMPIEVKQYTEAQVALAEIKAGMTPDLIITDLNMPLENYIMEVNVENVTDTGGAGGSLCA